MPSFAANMGAMALFGYVMLGNAITITLVRYLTDGADYSPFQLIFLANGLGALLCLPSYVRSRSTNPVNTAKAWQLFSLRAVMEFLSFSASFYAITLLPLPMHTALLFMAPIFGTIIAITVLREHGTLVTYATVVTGFFGMLIITQPGEAGESGILGVTFALLAALGFACCGTLVKVLTRHAPPALIAMRMMAMTSAIAAPFALSLWQPILPEHYMWLMLLGTLAFTLQHTVAMALSRVAFITVIPLNFLQLVAVSLLAWWIFAQKVSYYTLLGSLLILAATMINTWYSARHMREMSAEKDVN